MEIEDITLNNIERLHIKQILSDHYNKPVDVFFSDLKDRKVIILFSDKSRIDITLEEFKKELQTF